MKRLSPSLYWLSPHVSQEKEEMDRWHVDSEKNGLYSKPFTEVTVSLLPRRGAKWQVRDVGPGAGGAGHVAAFHQRAATVGRAVGKIDVSVSRQRTLVAVPGARGEAQGQGDIGLHVACSSCSAYLGMSPVPAFKLSPIHVREKQISTSCQKIPECHRQPVTRGRGTFGSSL